jgi:hypothetical protein
MSVQITLQDMLFVPPIHASNHAVSHIKLFAGYEFKICNHCESSDTCYSICTHVYKPKNLVFRHIERVRFTLDNWMQTLYSFIITKFLYSYILPPWHPFYRPKVSLCGKRSRTLLLERERKKRKERKSSAWWIVLIVSSHGF